MISVGLVVPLLVPRALCTAVTGLHRLPPMPAARLLASGRRGLDHPPPGYQASMNATLLWIIAAILVIAGIITLLSGSVILGIVLIVVGLLVGPGGHSIFNGRRRV